MTTDHNEAMSQLPHKLATLIKCLPQAPFRDHLAAECTKQAERIAELELQPAFAQLASDLAAKLAATEAKRDTLRAEVERQTSALKVIYTWAGIPGALKPENVRELSGKALGKATP